MSDPRSKEEIDTLLALFQKEDSPEVAPSGEVQATPAKVSTRDLLKPNVVAREHLRLLERLTREIAEKVALTLSSKLRLAIQCEAAGVDQLRYSTWTAEMGGPTLLLVLKLDPLSFPCVIALGLDLMHGAVDRVMGGSGVGDSTSQELTDAELVVAESVWVPVLERITEGLSRLVALTTRVQERRSIAMSAGILPAQEVVLTFHFKIPGERVKGDIRLAIPYAALGRHLPALQRNLFLVEGADPGGFRAPLQRSVRGVAMELGVRLGSTRLTLSEIMGLKKGDVVLLETRADDAVTASVEGRPKFSGRLGSRGNRFAFKVEQVLRSED
jgi:flagellar motor switch protein FliM